MAEEDEMFGQFNKERHIGYFKRCLTLLPQPYTSQDHNRMTLVFFAVSGLDLLGALDTIGPAQRGELIEWVYSNQVDPSVGGGFHGSNWLAADHDDSGALVYDAGHVAMTYCALLLLLLLGDDLSRVNRDAIVKEVAGLQNADGSFRSVRAGGESDMRFVYCGCAVSRVLDDWRGVNRDLATRYIVASVNYDYGLGQGPGLESHGGSTYCGVAALALMGRLDTALTIMQREGLVGWLIRRQTGGFQGRPGKPADACYSFWIGAALHLLGAYQHTDAAANAQFINACQFEHGGGIAKYPDHYPDILHTYLGVCGMALVANAELKTVHCALNVSRDAAQRLLHLAND